MTQDSEWVVAIQVTDYGQYQLVKENVVTKESLYFKYRHELPAESVILYESENVVMSGGLDQMTVIYNWMTGIVLKTMHLIIGPISSLFRVGDLAVLGENHSLRFLDTRKDVELKMMDPIQTHCKFVSCMDVIPVKMQYDEEPQKILVYGGSESGNLNTMVFDQNMKGNINLVFGKQSEKKIQLLETENERLKRENDLLKSKVESQVEIMNSQELKQSQKEIFNNKETMFKFKAHFEQFVKLKGDFYEMKEKFLHMKMTLIQWQKLFEKHNIDWKSEVDYRFFIKIII